MGIALSGGSARGYGHVGVLRALDEHGIFPGVVSGTSMGAVVGALYAVGYPVAEIQEILIRESIYKVLGFSWQRTGLLKLEKLREVLKKYIDEDDFMTFKTPFYLGVTNLNKARHEVRSSGPLYDYLIATCSVPGVFAPMRIDGCSYVDGGLMCNLPVPAIRSKCKILIGSHVNYPGNIENLTSPKVILERSVNLGITQNAKPQMEKCDYLIDPPEMQNYSLFDFKKTEEIMEVGYRYTMGMIERGELPVKRMII